MRIAHLAAGSTFYIIYNEKNGENKYYNNISNTTDDKYHITIL